MQFPITKKKTPPKEAQLLQSFRQLGEQDQETLLAFADFLAAREENSSSAEATKEPEPVAKPQHEPRPMDETVVAAIKRLTRTYPMVERGQIFHEVSELMTQHLVQGREARVVIDDLEALFLARYQALAE